MEVEIELGVCLKRVCTWASVLVQAHRFTAGGEVRGDGMQMTTDWWSVLSAGEDLHQRGGLRCSLRQDARPAQLKRVFPALRLRPGGQLLLTQARFNLVYRKDPN